MSRPSKIAMPAGYVSPSAMAFSDAADNVALVSEAARLPVATAPLAPPPLAGTAAASQVVGPFAAVAGRVVSVALAGTFTGTVRLLRSTDGGTTRVPLRVAGAAWAEYSVPGCEQAWAETEEGASFYLDIALTAGSVSYRVSQ